MKYQRFDDLPVLKPEIELAVGLFALTEKPNLRGRGDLKGPDGTCIDLYLQ